LFTFKKIPSNPNNFPNQGKMTVLLENNLLKKIIVVVNK